MGTERSGAAEDPRSDRGDRSDLPWTSPRHWTEKFGRAFRGIPAGMHGQSSFVVHVVATIAVVALAAFLRLDAVRWAVLVLAIGFVWTAELVNSALEILARTIRTDDRSAVGRALDIASGAVLVAAIAAVIVGLIVLLPDLATLAGASAFGP